MTRRRFKYVMLALATIGAGLLVHEVGAGLTPPVRDVAGDALWAAMLFWWVSALFPRARVLVRATAVFAMCAGVEASQLYHTPALDAFRMTTIGQLVIGSGFDWRDFAAYAAGDVVAAAIDRALLR